MCVYIFKIHVCCKDLCVCVFKSVCMKYRAVNVSCLNNSDWFSLLLQNHFCFVTSFTMSAVSQAQCCSTNTSDGRVNQGHSIHERLWAEVPAENWGPRWYHCPYSPRSTWARWCSGRLWSWPCCRRSQKSPPPGCSRDLGEDSRHTLSRSVTQSHAGGGGATTHSDSASGRRPSGR